MFCLFFLVVSQMDLRHLHSPDENLVEIGMNLKDYYPSGEWDILDVPAERHAKKYDCCPEFFAGKVKKFFFFFFFFFLDREKRP